MTGVRNPARCPLFLDRAFLDLDEIIDADDVEQSSSNASTSARGKSGYSSILAVAAQQSCQALEAAKVGITTSFNIRQPYVVISSRVSPKPLNLPRGTLD